MLLLIWNSNFVEILMCTSTDCTVYSVEIYGLSVPFEG